MALQPQDRPPGSAQVLRFVGSVTPGVAIGTWPKANGEVTTGGAVSDPRGMRFLLADATDLLNTERQMSPYVYDDRQPGGDSPHAAVATLSSGLIVNAGEQDIELRTWAENTWVIGKIISTTNVTRVDTQACRLVLDTLSSGLGLDTGLPVLIVPVVLSGAEVAAASFDILIEIRHSTHR